MLLVTDMNMEGVVRERMLVAFHRYRSAQCLYIEHLVLLLFGAFSYQYSVTRICCVALLLKGMFTLMEFNVQMQ